MSAPVGEQVLASEVASGDREHELPDDRVTVVDAIERWFAEVRAPKGESEHTARAYRADLRSLLDVAASMLAVGPGDVLVTDLAPLPVMRRTFGAWSQGRAPRSVRRGHSTWSTFFEYLVSEELVPGSPMPGVGKPKNPKRQPKPFTPEATSRIVQTVQTGGVERRDPWPELDEAIVITDLITGARTAELLGANIADVNRSPGNESIRVLGKGGDERTVPIEPILLDVLARYLDSRRARFPAKARQRGVPEDASAWDWWQPDAPLFVDRRGERLGEGALRYLITLVYRAAGVKHARGALTHALRHTAASRVAESAATVVELMQLFGWASLSSPQSYVDATAREVRKAARSNPVYDQLALGDATPPAPE